MIREYRETDCAELAELFYHTVHTVNAKDYTEEQLAAWATGKVDLEKWNQTFQEHHTVVAVENKVIVGFGDIDKCGYLDRLYVHKDHQQKALPRLFVMYWSRQLLKILLLMRLLQQGRFFEKKEAIG